MTMTAVTPMMMPSMVRKVRILLPMMFFRDWVKVSMRFISRPPSP